MNLKEYKKKYYENNKERLLEKAKEWQKNNPEKVKATKRKHKNVALYAN